MNNPIITVIRNNTNEDRFIRWTGEGTVWVGANASVEVPYEVWSKADRKQRVSILADTQQNNVSLTLKVLTGKDEYATVVFDPSASISHTPKAPVSTPVISAFAEDGKRDEEMHTIKANSQEVKAAASHYGVGVAVESVSEAVKVESTQTSGFSVVTDDTDVRRTVVQQAPDTVEQPAEEPEAEQHPVYATLAAAEDTVTDSEVVEEEEEVTEEAPAVMDTGDVKQAFNEAVQAKNWNGALQILIDEFGSDNVKITTRVIMALKDYDAIVKKYNLVK